MLIRCFISSGNLGIYMSGKGKRRWKKQRIRKFECFDNVCRPTIWIVSANSAVGYVFFLFSLPLFVEN